MDFKSLKLKQPLLKAISDLGYETPSDIQQKAIPHLVEFDSDFVGLAQTGSGKTAAFVLPLLNRLEENGVLQSIILTPSRELAKQVEKEVNALGKYLNLNSIAIYGGISYDKQISQIRKNKPEILVGTPGRIIDLINQGVLKLASIQNCILDEADEMLRMGFFDDVKSVIEKLHKKKNIWMFSATMPNEISRLIENEFTEPFTVKAKQVFELGPDIDQRFYMVERRRREEALFRILQVEENYHAIIFCRTRQETRELSGKLIDRGLRVECLSGEMSQDLREAAMHKFRTHKTNIMVCTDVAARGIDVKDITHVFNYGLPQDNEAYVHRIGRTARAGKSGVAATIIPPTDKRALERIAHATNNSIRECFPPGAKEMKEKVITNNLARIGKIIEAVKDKGDEYQVDDLYKTYAKFFKGLSKGELEKVMFTYLFNKELRQIEDLGDLKPKKGAFKVSRRASRENQRAKKFGSRKRRENSRERSSRPRRARR